MQDEAQAAAADYISKHIRFVEIPEIFAIARSFPLTGV